MANGDRYLVLACDGGGIRGVVTSLLLQNLGQSLVGSVDLYAGNSTGSIIAIALASGSLTVDQLAEFYLDPSTCSTIFQSYEPGLGERAEAVQVLAESKRPEIGEDLENLALGDLGKILPDLLFPMYTSDGLRSLLEENLLDLTLDQVWTEKGKRLLAPTFRLHGGEGEPAQWAPAAMHNLPNLPELGSYGDVDLVDAAMCSADPPILFAPHQLASGGQFTDGALFANNPATLAMTALIGSGVLDERGIDLSDVYLLSLGTGFNPASFPPSKPTFPYRSFPYGVLGWLWPKQTESTPPLPLLSAVSSAGSQIDTFQARMLLGPDNFRRGNVDFDQQILSQADCSGVPAMTKLTEEYIQSDGWREIVEWVTANFV